MCSSLSGNLKIKKKKELIESYNQSNKMKIKFILHCFTKFSGDFRHIVFPELVGYVNPSSPQEHILRVKWKKKIILLRKEVTCLIQGQGTGNRKLGSFLSVLLT